MRIRFWVSTDIVGSTVEDEIELEDNLSEDEIYDEAYDAVMDHVEWGYEKIEKTRKVEPKLIDNEWKCGKCGHPLECQRLLNNILHLDRYNYCPNCGRAVKW